MGGSGKSITGVRGIMGYIENSRPAWAIEDPILKILSKVVRMWNPELRRLKMNCPEFKASLCYVVSFRLVEWDPVSKTKNKQTKNLDTYTNTHPHGFSWTLIWWPGEIKTIKDKDPCCSNYMEYCNCRVCFSNCTLASGVFDSVVKVYLLAVWSLAFLLDSPSRTLTLKIKVVGWGS